MNTDTFSRLRPDGTIEDLVTDLPGRGDHREQLPRGGPGWKKMYFGRGTATNYAVVGADNFAYRWLAKFPDFHDRPGQDITLTRPELPVPERAGQYHGDGAHRCLRTLRHGDATRAR